MATKKAEKELTLAEAFGTVVKTYRESAGLTQDKLAFHSEIDRGYMSQIERGIKNVTLPFVWKLAKALGAKPSELITATEKKLRERT